MALIFNPFTGNFDSTGSSESDPIFSQWLIDTPPLYSFTEEDPVFSAWLDTDPLSGFLTEETDPVFGTWQSTYDNHANWDTAYGWGNHTTAGYASLTGVETLTNKRITRRIVQSFGSDTSLTPASDTADVYEFSTTAALGTLTVNAPTGTPTAGQGLLLRIKTTNVQTYSWNGAYRTGTSPMLPTTSSGSSLTDYIAFVWNSSDSKWDIIGVSNGH
jgi:hypothetical protein